MALINHFEDMLQVAFSRLDYLVATLNGKWDPEQPNCLWKTFEANHLEKKSVNLVNSDDCEKVCKLLFGIYCQLLLIGEKYHLQNTKLGNVLANLRDRTKDLASQTNHNQRATQSKSPKGFKQNRIIKEITALLVDVENLYKKIESDKSAIEKDLNTAQQRADVELQNILTNKE